MALINRFVKYAFGIAHKNARSDDVIEEVSEPRSTSPVVTAEEKARLKIMIVINWVVVIIVLCGFFSILLNAWFRPDARVPDLVQDTVSGGVGYFFSLLVSFARHK